MKRVYYVGFYSGKYCRKRKNCWDNIAASMKMDFIISCLKELGYKVTVISITTNYRTGIYNTEHVIIDDKEEYYYMPYASFRGKGSTRTSGWGLKWWLFTHIKRNDIIISYHSLLYGNFFHRLCKWKKSKWIAQIEELYCMSQKDYQNKGFIKREEKMFVDADGFLFVNDLFPRKYGNGKPYAVSYGNYKIFDSKERVINPKDIGLVYTGIINEDRGIFQIMESMKLLPECYSLHVLGFGSEENMKRFHNKMKEINANYEKPRIFFDGTKTGQEYTDYLSQFVVGISIMDTSEEVAFNAFPSKILAYLGHSLYVVSSKSECIIKSEVADYLFFCDNTPESIADAIKEIDYRKPYPIGEKLVEMKIKFMHELNNVVKMVDSYD